MRRTASLKQRFGELQVTHILRDDGQIIETHGDTRMIVAEDPPIDVQCPLVGLLGERPLLLIAYTFREVIQQRRNVGGRGAGGFQNIQAAVVEMLCVCESILLVPQMCQSPERTSGFLAGGAELLLRKVQCLLQAVPPHR